MWHGARAHIDLHAIAANLKAIRSLIPPTTRILAVVKANAYGHGAPPVASRLEREGVDMLGVAFLPEGKALREKGVRTPAIILGGIEPEELEEAASLGLTPVVSSLEQLRRFIDALEERQRAMDVHLKIDTGMNRLGIKADRPEFDEALDLIGASAAGGFLGIRGILSHFSEAERLDSTATARQLAAFRKAADRIRSVLAAAGAEDPVLHMANSAASLYCPEARFDMIRIGIALYGISPDPGRELPPGFRPVMRLTSRVMAVKELAAGEAVSYGGTYRAAKPGRIAVLPIGYADGYRRSFGNCAHVLIRGRKAPVVGTICMDLTLVDVSGLPDACRGDEVVLLGGQGEERISAWDLACWAETIPYEICCQVGPRVERVYEG